MSASMFSLQLGQAVGALAGDILTGCEVSLPIVPAPTVALMPAAVASFAEGLEIDLAQVRLYLAVREVARARLFAGVPWLGPQLLAAVRDYARDITIDTEGSSRPSVLSTLRPRAAPARLAGPALRPEPLPRPAGGARPSGDPAGARRGLGRRRDGPGHRPAPAPGRGARRSGPATPGERWARREDLRGPRRARAAPAAAARCGQPLRRARGRPVARRPGTRAWAHPDVAPGPGDLDDPLGYVERSGTRRDDLDAELDAMLRAARTSPPAGRR